MERDRNEKFYNKDWFLWLSLILFAPVGIFLLWKRHRFNGFSRVALSLIFGLLFLSAFGISGQMNRVAQNRSNNEMNYARVGYTNSSYFNFWKRWAGIFTIPRPTPNVTPSPTVNVTPGATSTPAIPPIVTPGPTAIVTPPIIIPNPTAQATQPPIITPTQGPTTQPVGSDWKALQDKIFELTNVERQKNGLASFVYNSAVEKYALDKSLDMANKNYFDHNSPTNGYFYDIWKRDGFKYSSGAENLYTASDSRGFASKDINSLAQSIVTGWMNSEGHRKNILNGNLKELGVGVAEKNNKLYATQLFRTN